MFVSPSNMLKNKILKNRTITFESVQKTHGNIVMIPTLDSDAFIKTLSGNLFRPTQLRAIYTPRIIKPKNKSVVRMNQKDYYNEIKVKTGGKISRGKIDIAAYNGMNLVYDVYNSYIIHKDALSKIKKKRQLQLELIKMFEGQIAKVTSDPDYENVYIVFPMSKPYENGQRTIISCTDFDATDPLAIFLLGLELELLDLTKFKNLKEIFFYAPESGIMMAIDIHDPEFRENLQDIKLKIKRMNSLLSGEETIDDISDEVDASSANVELSASDKKENRKEEIKQIILSKISKDLKAKLTDFEAASSSEKDLIVIIDDKVEKYLSKPENLSKSLADMADEIEKDPDVKTKAIKFVETKKASVLRAETISKGLSKEIDVISSIRDLDVEEKTVEPSKFNVDIDHIDPRIEESYLASFDEEYNKKQLMTDVTNVISSFSETQVFPMTVDSLNIEDTSTHADEKYTYHVRYKTNEGKPISFQLDVPKIVDKRYLFMGNDTKVIKKQLIRLPIVKTKADRVELTTNYAKMTIERTNGKLSRKNAYILKKLKGIPNTVDMFIEYGDNTLANSSIDYKSDFEYEELAGSISRIKTLKYELFFNREVMRDELDLLDTKLDDNFFDTGRTPIGFELTGENKKGIVYIDNRVIYVSSLTDGKSTKISESLFDYLVEILKLDMTTLPTIGNSFIYTTVKFLQTKYPLLAVVASQNGLTDILTRYVGKDNFYTTTKAEKNRIGYVGVKFKDCYLYYKDELKNTLLLNPLYQFDTTEYDYAQFDADIPYTDYFIRNYGSGVGMHIRNTLRLNLDVFIDPITRDILRDLNQPTNVIDVILYANTLLVGNQYKAQNDMTNYRVRSNELIPALMYKKIASAYVGYEKHRLNGRPMNINLGKNDLFKEILQQPNINGRTVLNPVIEAEQIAQASAKGLSGVNINDAYTLEMRAYDETMSGFISGNSTPYSGSAGITRAITYNPKIRSVRGYIPAEEQGDLNAANILSPTELLSAFTAAGADAPRQA